MKVVVIRQRFKECKKTTENDCYKGWGKVIIVINAMNFTICSEIIINRTVYWILTSNIKQYTKKTIWMRKEQGHRVWKPT